MNWTNYHTHSTYCDGKANLENYAKKAIEKKMYAIGFSGHSPVPFESGWNIKIEKLPDYIKDIEILKEKYKNKINLYMGLEVDYIENISGVKNFEKYNLDYTVGGIHYLKQFDDGLYWNYDLGKKTFAKGLEQIFGGDEKKLVKYYYEQVTNMIINCKPDIIAHLDLIKKFNLGDVFFNENENWYKDAVNQVLRVIKENDSIVEINTRGVFRGIDKVFYPNSYILKQCKKLNIRVTISGDAHSPNELDSLYTQASQYIMECGYNEITILDDTGWRTVGLTKTGLII